MPHHADDTPRFTEHARVQMDRRGITEAAVRYLLRLGRSERTGRGNIVALTVTMREVRRWPFLRPYLRLVVIQDGETGEVITAYWDKTGVSRSPARPRKPPKYFSKAHGRLAERRRLRP